MRDLVNHGVCLPNFTVPGFQSKPSLEIMVLKDEVYAFQSRYADTRRGSRNGEQLEGDSSSQTSPNRY